MKILPVSLLTVTATIGASSAFADENLEAQVASLKERIEVLESKPSSIPSDSSLTLYGSLRPTIEYRTQSDSNDDRNSELDQRDALSQLGLKGSTAIAHDINAFFKSEWSVNLNNNGELGSARQVYVGLESTAGKVALGRQRPSQYLLISEYIDIFNHASSPFGYDSNGLFFVSDSFTYQYSNSGVTFHSTLSANGRSGSNDADITNFGLGFDRDGLHIGVTFLDKAIAEGNNVKDREETKALALANSFGNLYVAAAYQTSSYSNSKYEKSTFDIVSSYNFGNGYKIKAGLFGYDDGNNGNESGQYTGYNFTVENQLASNVRIHTEYLIRDFDSESTKTFNSITFGLRYDFNIDMK